MKLLKYITRKLSNLYRRFLIRRNRFLFYFNSWQNNSSIIIGKDVIFNVPVRNDGLGVVHIGAKTMLGYGPAYRLGNGEIFLQPRCKNAQISIGERCGFSNNISICAREKIVVGDGCLIGSRCIITDADHEIIPEERRKGPGKASPVHIGDNVWLGDCVIVLKGVSIGKGSVIAAGAVVAKDIPDRVIAGGVPAKVIRKI